MVNLMNGLQFLTCRQVENLQKTSVFQTTQKQDDIGWERGGGGSIFGEREKQGWLAVTWSILVPRVSDLETSHGALRLHITKCTYRPTRSLYTTVPTVYLQLSRDLSSGVKIVFTMMLQDFVVHCHQW